jgi:hypothetical protein
MRHPAEFYLKALCIQNPTFQAVDLFTKLEQGGFMSPLAQVQNNYLPALVQEFQPGGENAPPTGFNFMDQRHRASMRYLRDQGVYDYFVPSAAMRDARDILIRPDKRLVVEQALFSRIPSVELAKKINQQKNWHLTADGIDLYKHYYWNIDLLTFDDWGRFLYGRTAVYERMMSMMTADTQLALSMLQVSQTIESRHMITEIQKASYFTFMECHLKPGTSTEKVKNMNMLGKTVLECHAALNTEGMALKDILKNFEKWRMERPADVPPPIQQLTAGGSFSGNGVREEQPAKPDPTKN